MGFSASDHRYMGRALELARRGLYTTDPNPRVGCVLVRDGEVVGEGWHHQAGGPHAEVFALRAAGERARGATAYVSLEPCSHHGRTPPCSEALIAAGVARVVAAMEDPNDRVAGKGLARLREAGVAVQSGLMAEAAEALNPGFVARMRHGRPWVRCKLAASLDGRTAMASGESRWITGEAARRDVHRWRARSSAVLTGIGTALADDPRLDARMVEAPRQPRRVVLDSTLRLPPRATLLQEGAPPLVFTCGGESAAAEALRAAGAELVEVPAAGGRMDLHAVLGELARRECNEVLVEAGAELSGALLQAGLVDELLLYLAPVLMGDAARGLFRLPGLDTMAQRLELEILDVRPVGRDWRMTARPAGRG